jgi:hypothetical protein
MTHSYRSVSRALHLNILTAYTFFPELSEKFTTQKEHSEFHPVSLEAGGGDVNTSQPF